MSIARILLLSALFQPALAQPPLPVTDPFSQGSDLRVVDTAHAMRFALGISFLSIPQAELRSSVFTSDYWLRAYEQRAQLEARFGIHTSDALALRPYATQQVPGHPQFGFVQELPWPGAKPLAGLQFERKDLLFQGDRLSIRATSDVQVLLREAGLLKSSAEIDALSLLGWRSHSQLVWQLGEPTREVQWQFTARFDRRAYSQTNTVGLSALRRF
jgi:hypothetical protein